MNLCDNYIVEVADEEAEAGHRGVKDTAPVVVDDVGVVDEDVGGLL